MNSDYRNLFHAAGDQLSTVAERLCGGLQRDDVCGLFIGVGVAGWMKDKTRAEVADRLREIADALDRERMH